jgi:hypothetical protein
MLAFGIGLGCGACALPEKPNAPSYEVDIDLSVANERVTMEQVVADRQGYLRVQSDGTLGLRIQQDLDPFAVGDNLSISPPERDFELPISGAGAGFASGFEAALPQEIGVTEARIRSGALRFDLSNSSGRPLEVSLSLPDFTLEGQRAQGTASVPAGGTATLTVSLSGSAFKPSSPFALRFDAAVTASATGASGILRVGLRSDPLLLENVAGRFDDLDIRFETDLQEIGFPDGSFNVALVAASIEVEIRNGIGADSELDLTVVGRRDDGRSVILTLPADQRSIAGGSPGAPVLSTVRLDEANSNVVELLNLIPTSIEVSGGVLITDSDAVVARTDEVDLKVTFRSPLELVLEETTIYTDPKDIGVDDADARRRLSTNVGTSTVTLKMTNHLPIGIGVRLMVDSNSEELKTSPDLVIPRQGEITLAPAPADPATGKVRESVLSQSEIQITAQEIAVFSQYPLYSRVAIRVAGTDGQRVRITQDDFAEVLMRARIRVQVNNDL